MNTSRKILQKFLYRTNAAVNFYSVQSVKLPKQHEWNRAVASAEKMVGFPTSMLHLRSLMTDDVTGMTEHMRKLMESRRFR